MMISIHTTQSAVHRLKLTILHNWAAWAISEPYCVSGLTATGSTAAQIVPNSRAEEIVKLTFSPTNITPA